MDEMIKNLEDMQIKFKKHVCNQFLIHGNINDYLPVNSHYSTIREWLEEWLDKSKFDMCAFYDLSAGLQFPNPNHERLFRDITGYTKPKPNISEEEKQKLSDEELKKLEASLKALENSPEPELPKSPVDVFKIIEQVIGLLPEEKDKKSRKYRLALIIDFAETIAPADNGNMSDADRVNSVALRRLAQERVAGESIVILLASGLGDIHTSLRGRGSRMKTVEIPLPHKDQRCRYIEQLVKKNGRRVEMSTEELTHNTGGLTLREIEDIWKQAQVVNMNVITTEKTRLLEAEFDNILKILKPRWGLTKGIGGMDHIKPFCSELKAALVKGDPRLVPPAMILMGPPGTGKTALAEALAFEWGVPFVEILNMRNMYVGQSETIALRVMSALQSLSPCVVFWDEFDQEESPRGSYQGDSGVSARLRKIRFQITSDPRNRGKFLFIYATNRPDLIDIADKRSGRGSVRIPMLLPDAKEQEQIFAIMPQRYDFKVKATMPWNDLVKELIAKCGDVSGADIEEISLTAYRQSVLQGHKKVEVEDYQYAINDFVPHPYSGSVIKKQEESAILERSSNRFLSARGKELLTKIKSCKN